MTIKKPIAYTHEYEVVTPSREIAYPIPKGDWEHIKTRIRNLNFDTPIYQNIGSCLIGIGISTIICAITYPQPVSNITIYYSLWVIGIVGAIVGIICWIFDHSLKTIRKNECSDIILEMEANEPPQQM